jgi:hypothetical protein
VWTSARTPDQAHGSVTTTSPDGLRYRVPKPIADLTTPERGQLSKHPGASDETVTSSAFSVTFPRTGRQLLLDGGVSPFVFAVIRDRRG